MKIRYSNSVFSARRKRFSAWRYGLNLGLAAAVIIWWWLQNQRQENVNKSETRVILPPDEEKLAAKPVPAAKPKAPPAGPDDLTSIDGIGPKYAAVLAEAGVDTFGKLAEMAAADVHEIFRAATGRTPDPSDWIKQAKKLSG